MRALLRLLHRLYLRHELSIINDAITEEERRHEEYPRRHESWLRIRALLMMRLDGIEPQSSVSYGLAGRRMARATRRS
jgi:hypothetical protein